MIKINEINIEYRKDLSIGDILEQFKNDPAIVNPIGKSQIIILNGKIISNKENYQNMKLNNGDEIKVIPMAGGG